MTCDATAEPIAVIGMGCRLPGTAHSPEAFWDMLLDGRDGIVEVPASRWPIDAWHDSERATPGKMNMRRAGFLEQDIDGFDAEFFGVAPREAASMDPQQRLLLEVSWEALEDAGCPAENISGTDCGVFVGLYNNNYGLMLRGSPAPGIIDAWSASGAHTSVAAGRLSYFLNLRGPSMALDTACSSSLVAVHLALQSLRSGECSMALAGGVHLLLSPESLVASTKLGATSADGRCKSFDIDADGFGHGEGCGIVVLKRLADAEAAGDRVLAVIRGSCVNQDGRSNSLTAPNGPAQEALVRGALKSAAIAPRLVGYVEAHGTGTRLGDPIEIEALAEVLGEGRDAPLYVGSVKTNLGHLEAAAGIAGLIKAVLCVQHGVVPAHLNFSTLNPDIDPGLLQLRVAQQATPWQGIDGRRIAAVSAFGFSGTNAHVVLESWPEPAPVPAAVAPDTSVHLLPLSARSAAALAVLAQRWASWLESGMVSAADAAFTAGAGRSHHRHRLAVAGSNAPDMARALREAPVELVRRAPRIAFVFTGQGSQYAGMGARAYRTQPVFRATLDRHAALLDKLLGQPALALLFGQASLDDTALAQPLVVAIELALAAQWRAWGIVPTAVMGHSVGEYAAAAVAGVLSEEAALTLVAHRGHLMQALPAGGGMLVALADADTVGALLGEAGPGLSIAAINGPANTAVSGELAALERLERALAAREIVCVRLPVSHAFHSALLEPMLDDFERCAADYPGAAPRIPIVSNLSGAVHRHFDAAHWRAHARAPVRFAEGIGALAALGCETFLELGPQAVLTGLGRAVLAPLTFVASVRRGVDDDAGLLTALAALYRAGATVRWDALGSPGARKVAAPTYPFQHQSHWLSLPGEMVPPAGVQQAGTPVRATGSAVVYDFYDELTVVSEQDQAGASADDDEGHLTFGFLPAPVPGFSWIRALFEKQHNPGERALFLSSQRELKDNLFDGIDFGRMQRVLDYGCGHAADLCELGLRHPHLQLQGFTISAGQVEVGQRRIARLGLGQRVRLQRSDSSAVPFPGMYDLIFGFEVTGLIADKDGLFNNIAGHLQPGGLLVIADFVSCADAIANPQTNSFTPSSAQWVDLLSRRRLRLVRAVDASADVADWLVDPDFASNLDVLVQRFALGELTRRHLLSNENIGKALRLHLMRYLLLTAQHAPHETESALRSANEAMLRDAVLYRATPNAAASAPWRGWLYRVDWQAHASAALKARPDTAALADRLAGAVQRERAALAAFDPLGATLDAISAGYARAALRALGCRDLAQAAQIPVIEPMRRLRDHLVKTLAGGSHQLDNDADPDALAAALLESHPALTAELTLLRRCGPHLADVLSGRVDPLTLLFPDGDASLAESLYDSSPFSRAVQQLAADAVALLPRDQALSVIEIGAGTGATTAHILPHLPPGSRYLYTDLGASLLKRARAKFGGHSIDFAQLDIGLPPSAQGIAGGRWDMLVAANVLHATPDLAQTMGHVRELLAPGGLLLMVENTGRLNWGDLTFGLTQGMWNFRDTGLRDHALLYQAQWRTLLEQLGFDGVQILTPGEPDEGGVSQQCVIIARRAARRHFLLSAAAGADSDALAAALRARGHQCTLATHDAAGVPGTEVSDLVHLAAGPSEARMVLAPALRAAQAVAARTEPLRLTIVSHGAYALAHDGAPDPHTLAQACLPGFVRTVGAERPASGCRLIDLDPASDASSQTAALVAALLDDSAAELALRAGGMQVPRLQPLPASLAGTVRFDPAASYIVTGAFGGIGLALLEWMAARGARTLVLCGRSAPSAQAEAVLQRLRDDGVALQVQLGDVAQAEHVQAMVGAAQVLGPLKGVMHAAGVVADAALERQDMAHFDSVLKAKVDGATHLHHATAGLALEHFVLFSSAAALLGPAGQVNHAAANAFAAGLVHQRRAQGLAALAIDWGAWAGIGAAAGPRIGAAVERSGLVPMAPEQALHALGWAMGSDQPGVGVLDVDWARYLTRFDAGGEPDLLVDIAARQRTAARQAREAPQPVDAASDALEARPAPAATLRATLHAAQPLQRRGMLLEAIRNQAAQIMALPDALAIDDARPLRDLGLDSLMSIELRNALVRLIGSQLPATLLFDNASVAALADVLSGGVMADLFAPALAPADALAGLDAAALSALLGAELDGDGP